MAKLSWGLQFLCEKGGSWSADGTVRLSQCPPGLCCTLAMTWGKRLSEGLIGFESPVKCMCSAQVKAVILKCHVVGVAVQGFSLLLLH